MVSAFTYFGSMDVVYRDLKPENLVISASGQLKVIDLAMAKVLRSGKTFTVCGTPDYLAPEVVRYLGYNTAVDWWGLGVLVHEV